MTKVQRVKFYLEEAGAHFIKDVEYSDNLEQAIMKDILKWNGVHRDEHDMKITSYEVLQKE